MYIHLLQCNTFDTFDMPTIEYVTFHTIYTANTCTYQGRKDSEMPCLSWTEGVEGLCGRSQNTVPIASTQVAIKGIVQYSTRERSRSQSGSVLSRTQSRAHAQRSRSRHARRIAHRSVTTSCTYVSAINTTNFIQCNRCVQT